MAKKVKVEEQDSKKYDLNKKDLTKIGKGALNAVGGALLTFLAEVVGQINFGEYTYVVVPVAAILINAGLKFIKEN